MPFGRRRRPLARAAVVGGAAYYAGKRVQGNRDEQAAYEDQVDELSARADEADEGVSNADIDQLRKLAELKDAGVLTTEEFDAQKRKILGN
jgi:hypothetical protein